MSKRVRGAVRTHRRPGARPPSERIPGQRRVPAAPGGSQLEVAEVVAEEVMVEELPDERRVATTRAEAARAPRSGTRIHHKIKAGSVLATRAATEYVYVAQDMRRIMLVAGGLVAVLFVLWFLIVVAKVIPLPFY